MLADWLRRVEPDRALTLEDFESKGDGTGWSNETVFATLVDGTRRSRVVIRIGPPDPDQALFPDYDIPLQFDVMTALAAAPGVPVPKCHWVEREAGILPTPFFVMDAVPGQVPSDKPPHTVEGWLRDATPGDRGKLYRSSINALAGLANVDPQAIGLATRLLPDASSSPLAAHLDRFERIYRWGRRDSGPFPEGDRAIRWLRENAPTDEPLGLLWGDARFANMIYQDFEAVALLDWELAAIGNPECDLTYFLVHQFLVENHPVSAYRSNRLSGFLSDDETVALWEESVGRKATHFAYYWTFNAFKLVAMMQRWAELAQESRFLTREAADQAKLGGALKDQLVRYVG